MRPATLFLALLAAGCAGAPTENPRPFQTKVAGDPPAVAPAPTDTTTWHVHLDTRRHRLGAYTVVLRYNPDVAYIEDIRPCGVQRFKGSPEFDDSSFTSGTTRVTSLDAFPRSAPDGDYHLLTITFRRVAAGTLNARAEIEKAYDQLNKPLRRARIAQPAFTHAFR